MEGNLEHWTEDGKDGDFAWTDVPSEVFVPVSATESTCCNAELPG